MQWVVDHGWCRMPLKEKLQYPKSTQLGPTCVYETWKRPFQLLPSFEGKKTIYIGSTPHPVTVESEGYRDVILFLMIVSRWWGVDPTYTWYLWTPKPWKIRVLGPPNMGEITPKNKIKETWVAKWYMLSRYSLGTFQTFTEMLRFFEAKIFRVHNSQREPLNSTPSQSIDQTRNARNANLPTNN